MSPFELTEPRSLREAVTLLAAAGSEVRPLGGGTALMLMMKLGVLRPQRIVSLRGVEPDCFTITAATDGALRIGAMATLSVIEHSGEVRTRFPAITRALHALANVRVRNVATLGGHLAHADPHMDLPPLLIALGAVVSGVGAGGAWSKPLESLYTGYLETTLAQGDLIAAVTIPYRASRRAAYRKCTTRSADDWPALGIAVALDFDGGVVREARVVVSAATDVPTRLTAAEDLLCGSRADDAALRGAADAGAAQAKLIGDQHGSAAYKRELLRAHLPRTVRDALGGAAQ